MGEFAKRRSARDLWISRSHVAAATVAAAVFSLTSFGLGFVVGHRTAPIEEASSGRYIASAAPDGLIGLLARVEANRQVGSEDAALTFPDALQGIGMPLLPEVAVHEPPVVQVEPGEVVPPGAVRRPGVYTIELVRTVDRERAYEGLAMFQSMELDAWVGAELVNGELQYRLNVGGFPTSDDAEQALIDVHASVGGMDGIAPVVAENPR